MVVGEKKGILKNVIRYSIESSKKCVAWKTERDLH